MTNVDISAPAQISGVRASSSLIGQKKRYRCEFKHSVSLVLFNAFDSVELNLESLEKA